MSANLASLFLLMMGLLGRVGEYFFYVGLHLVYTLAAEVQQSMSFFEVVGELVKLHGSLFEHGGYFVEAFDGLFVGERLGRHVYGVFYAWVGVVSASFMVFTVSVWVTVLVSMRPPASLVVRVSPGLTVSLMPMRCPLQTVRLKPMLKMRSGLFILMSWAVCSVCCRACCSLRAVAACRR